MSLASSTCENAALNGFNALNVYLSAHTGTPGTSGLLEVAGGSYARQSITWSSASGGSTSNTGAISVPIPASTTVSYFGSWSALTSGTYYIGGALTSSQTFSTAGTLSFAIGAVTLSAS